VSGTTSWGRAILGIAAAFAAIVAFAPGALAQATQVRVLHTEASDAAVALRRALAAPHARVNVDSGSSVALGADSAISTSVIVFGGGDATVGGVVRGDVTIIGGDLFLHPAASIEGRATAIGGGVYPSSLASVRDGIESYRDVSFALIESDDGPVFVSHIDPPTPAPLFALPLYIGVRIPTYERASGLSLPWGPVITLQRFRAELHPTVTWRTHLGEIDPGITGQIALGRAASVDMLAQRSTYTNDAWMRSDMVNSAVALGLGTDVRNYYRADRAEGRYSIRREFAQTRIEPFLGARVERGWSVGPDSAATGAPWSAFNRNSREGMLRPNPPVERGTITSLLAGTRAEWEQAGVRASGTMELEIAGSSPTGSFVQATTHFNVDFPTFSDHWFEVTGHLVTTGGGSPGQRHAYLGGSPTLPTEPLLEMGGEQLLFLESTYLVPFERITIPIIGFPTIFLRHAIGGAGSAFIPELVQNVGGGVMIGFFKAEATVNPETRKWALSLGLSLGT
jgi:hypothetical protein